MFWRTAFLRIDDRNITFLALERFAFTDSNVVLLVLLFEYIFAIKNVNEEGKNKYYISRKVCLNSKYVLKY